MGYRTDPSFTPPTDPEISIWRYMDFTRFVSMLDSGGLHFARADQMSDPFEGSTPRQIMEAWDQKYYSILNSHWKLFDPDDVFKQLRRERIEAARYWREHLYLSCWHMSEFESAAMWQLYQAIQGRGIAVRSTFARLVNSIRDPRLIYAGVVQYIDFATASGTKDPVAYGPFLLKRKSFEFERELRAVLSAHNPTPLTDEGKVVQVVDVDLDALVEAIYVAPGAPLWFADLVRALTIKYQHDWTILHSVMDAEPFF